jgi:hypothetical protein
MHFMCGDLYAQVPSDLVFTLWGLVVSLVTQSQRNLQWQDSQDTAMGMEFLPDTK